MLTLHPSSPLAAMVSGAVGWPSTTGPSTRPRRGCQAWLATPASAAWRLIGPRGVCGQPSTARSPLSSARTKAFGSPSSSRASRIQPWPLRTSVRPGARACPTRGAAPGPPPHSGAGCRRPARARARPVPAPAGPVTAPSTRTPLARASPILTRWPALCPCRKQKSCWGAPRWHLRGTSTGQATRAVCFGRRGVVTTSRTLTFLLPMTWRAVCLVPNGGCDRAPGQGGGLSLCFRFQSRAFSVRWAARRAAAPAAPATSLTSFQLRVTPERWGSGFNKEPHCPRDRR